jgi:hypothetical protein
MLDAGLRAQALLLLSSVAVTPMAAAQLRLGSEFQVNSHTPGVQHLPALDLDSNGDFVVAWRNGGGRDGNGYGVFGRRFNSSGVAQGADFQINSYTSEDQLRQDVALDDDGNFVVTWSSYGQDGDEWGVFAQRFDATGARLGGEFQVTTYTAGDQSFPVVARDADGDFVVAWQETTRDGVGYGVFAQRFNAAGVRQGADFLVNSYISSNQSSPSIALDDSGDFVIAWKSFGQDQFGDGIFGRRFNAAGVAQATEFQVNTYTPESQIYPSVAIDTDGDFVIAWQSNNGQDGNAEGIFARRFASSGLPQGAELQVNTFFSSNQSDPAAAMTSSGDFVLTWHSIGQDGSGTGVIARAWSSNGNALGAEFVVNSATEIGQQYAAAAMDGDGDFVLAWQSVGQDGSGIGIFAQRFALPAVLDIDLDGEVEALTDGLLVLRFIFGFSGSVLINGAVAPDCNRCDAPAIGAYLVGLTVLDVDGNGGAPDALTDGLLVLRFSFGFAGSTLVGGAVGQGCTRCDGPAVVAYLQPLV